MCCFNWINLKSLHSVKISKKPSCVSLIVKHEFLFVNNVNNNSVRKKSFLWRRFFHSVSSFFLFVLCLSSACIVTLLSFVCLLKVSFRLSPSVCKCSQHAWHPNPAGWHSINVWKGLIIQKPEFQEKLLPNVSLLFLLRHFL